MQLRRRSMSLDKIIVVVLIAAALVALVLLNRAKSKKD